MFYCVLVRSVFGYSHVLYIMFPRLNVMSRNEISKLIVVIATEKYVPNYKIYIYASLGTISGISDE